MILALAGLKRVLTKAKFTTSSRVQNQLEEYEENNNPIIGFVQEIGMDAVENEQFIPNIIPQICQLAEQFSGFEPVPKFFQIKGSNVLISQHMVYDVKKR